MARRANNLFIVNGLCDFNVVVTPRETRNRRKCSSRPHFCKETGHALVAFGEEAGAYRFVIRKREDPPA